MACGTAGEPPTAREQNPKGSGGASGTHHRGGRCEERIKEGHGQGDQEQRRNRGDEQTTPRSSPSLSHPPSIPHLTSVRSQR